MKISFYDEKLCQLCEKQDVAQRKLGAVCAKKLRARLADCQAVACVSELVAGKPHPLKGDRLGQFSLSLEGGKRLVFKPTHKPVPVKDDGSVDWSKVTEICVVFIGDYHD